MVFSSLEFILFFLPSTLLCYYLFLHLDKKRYALLFILLASLFYYAYWKIENTLIIISSIIVNYTLGNVLSVAKRFRKILFLISISINIILLFYFKYTIFALETIESITHITFTLPEIILPIGISFFTFQQIAYLSDIYTRKHDPTGEGLLNYSLFICFFPQLVAGPIVHHSEMMPQFASAQARVVNWESIYKGLLIFSIGLAKKVLVADNLSPLVGYAFDKAGSLTFCEATYSALCYTLQLYFDFSGYCDMATGCGLMFNIRLPWNFNSPYKATTIQEFWRRWHMTLSRWLRDYLYIPLGGNRGGTGRTLVNLVLTFLLGGLWHGAAWTFVIWGAMHGLALVVHRLWSQSGKQLARPLSWLLTFSFINLAWIVFRAKDMDCLRRFAEAFAGFNGWMPRKSFTQHMCGDSFFMTPVLASAAVIFLFLLCCLGKNTRELLEGSDTKYIFGLSTALYAVSMFCLFIPDKSQEFIYFQF